MNRIAILVTTFQRDELLYKSIQSIVDLNLTDNYMILVADQGKISEEKAKWYLNMKMQHPETFHFRELPYDCGLSYARNRLVELAKEKRCEYCILASDSFLFNNSINMIEYLINSKLYNKDLIGFELGGCVCSWEAKLDLISKKCFELDFIEKDKAYSLDDNFEIYDCDITRNFFIAKTYSLIDCKWFEELKLGEHEAFFWNYKQKGYKVAWTNLISGTKMKDRPDEYANLRRINFQSGIQAVMKRYGLEKWVTYKNLERSKT